MGDKIKLRDMTIEWDIYLSNKCTGGDCCSNCIFTTVNCEGSECKDSWVNNKDCYSDKFLDQEVEFNNDNR